MGPRLGLHASLFRLGSTLPRGAERGQLDQRFVVEKRRSLGHGRPRRGRGGGGRHDVRRLRHRRPLAQHQPRHHLRAHARRDMHARRRRGAPLRTHRGRLRRSEFVPKFLRRGRHVPQRRLRKDVAARWPRGHASRGARRHGPQQPRSNLGGRHGKPVFRQRRRRCVPNRRRRTAVDQGARSPCGQHRVCGLGGGRQQRRPPVRRLLGTHPPGA